MNPERLPSGNQTIAEDWSKLISTQVELEELKGVTCSIYGRNANKEPPACVCGRSVHRHSFDGFIHKPESKIKPKKWIPGTHSKPVKLTVYGELASGARVCGSSMLK